MLLEQKSKRKRLFRKCLVIFFTVVVMISMCSITAFAAEDRLLDDVVGETPWPWPFDGIYESIRELLFNMVQLFMSCAFGLLDNGTTYATEKLAQTPWNFGGTSIGAGGAVTGTGVTIYHLVDDVASKVILPIGTIIFTYIVIYEFITMVMEKNNFHDFDTSVFIRWIFKTCIGIYFLSNSSVIINAFFELGSTLTDKLNSQISTSLGTGGTFAGAVLEFYNSIKAFGIGNLIGMLIPSFLIMIICLVIYVCIYVIVLSRICEIYLHISVAPIPMATITNREFGESGKNYLKIIFSFVLQAFFILLCIGIFKSLVVSLAGAIGAEGADFGTIVPKMFEVIAFGVCMVLLMFKSQSLAKTIVGAH